MNTNLLLMTDSYKISHSVLYPPKTEYVYSYIESRGGKWDRVLFFGLQVLLKDVLSKPITLEMIDEAEEFWQSHGMPFYRHLWEHILEKHNGYLPISIRAVPEGLVVPTNNVLATIVNTDPACFWLTSFLETIILRAIWYPTTVATNSFMCKDIIDYYMEMTTDDPEGKSLFSLHDFGARGVSSAESAALGGAAHLINFRGSDTVEGIMLARKYYNEPMAGFSIPAGEHSVYTSWGRDNEVAAYENMLGQFAKPGKMYAIVSDSYDFENAVTNIWGKELRQRVIDSGATLVVRPDSGNPVEIPVWTVEELAKSYGYETNSKGYNVLKNVRVIQGDGIGIEEVEAILASLEQKGFSAENMAFGMGGNLLQRVNRDTLKFAMKCSAICIDGKWQDVYKEPKTDRTKTSKKGQLALIYENGTMKTVKADGNHWQDIMVHVFRNGKILKEHTFAEIRERSTK
jgi:nicotinamide phosphoribosyltransferase